MKSVFRILLFAMAMTTFCVSTYAQKDKQATYDKGTISRNTG